MCEDTFTLLSVCCEVTPWSELWGLSPAEAQRQLRPLQDAPSRETGSPPSGGCRGSRAKLDGDHHGPQAPRAEVRSCLPRKAKTGPRGAPLPPLPPPSPQAQDSPRAPPPPTSFRRQFRLEFSLWVSGGVSRDGGRPLPLEGRARAGHSELTARPRQRPCPSFTHLGSVIHLPESKRVPDNQPRRILRAQAGQMRSLESDGPGGPQKGSLTEYEPLYESARSHQPMYPEKARTFQLFPGPSWGGGGG